LAGSEGSLLLYIIKYVLHGEFAEKHGYVRLVIIVNLHYEIGLVLMGLDRDHRRGGGDHIGRGGLCVPEPLQKAHVPLCHMSMVIGGSALFTKVVYVHRRIPAQTMMGIVVKTEQ
jgi:hypothetical protein